jgi:hypothetical protein
VGKIECGRKAWKKKIVSTTGSKCGMITPCGLSRIHNIHDHMLLYFGLWSQIVRMYKNKLKNYVKGNEKISGEETFQMLSINKQHFSPSYL